MEDILVKPALSEKKACPERSRRVEWDGIWASKTINQFFGVLSNVLSKVDILSKSKKRKVKYLTQIEKLKPKTKQRFLKEIKDFKSEYPNPDEPEPKRVDKRLTPYRNRLLLLSIHLNRTTAISLPTLFRGREIACSENKKLRLCCRVGQTPRQIKNDLACRLKHPSVYRLRIIYMLSKLILSPMTS